MPLRIEDYALIGDTQTAALVGKDGSIDWLCMPRFDSAACFAALLGDERHGRWQIAPSHGSHEVRRRYRHGTLILETEFSTQTGVVRLIDCMPPRGRVPDLVRIVEGVRGEVPMSMLLDLRFDYGHIAPWLRMAGERLTAMAGPDAVCLQADFREGLSLAPRVDFTVREGERVRFGMVWYPSHEPCPPPLDIEGLLADTEAFWLDWSGRCTYQGKWREEVLRSLITLKALTYEPTGGIVAAATTSLPEWIGSVRNWDYRYCWLRDATFTLYALMVAGFYDEARSWRDWLLRAVGGEPSKLQIMYGCAGERRLVEMELPWLPGYENSRPVRIGNGAAHQFQLDVYGEVMDALHLAERVGMPSDASSWALQRTIIDFVEASWSLPDYGIWEVRGPMRHFTHSKVMAWVAVDRAIKSVEHSGHDGPVERWRELRQTIHDQVCREGWSEEKQAFTQYYGGTGLDASLLMIPLVGFLPPEDPRVRSTVEAIERELWVDGFVMRYRTEEGVDGLPPGEGAFLACTFWLADNLALIGRKEDAERLFERLLALCNDVGLLAEEYDAVAKRQLGNFPQAFSHIGLINTARNLSFPGGPAEHRKEENMDEVRADP